MAFSFNKWVDIEIYVISDKIVCYTNYNNISKKREMRRVKERKNEERKVFIKGLPCARHHANCSVLIVAGLYNTKYCHPHFKNKIVFTEVKYLAKDN